MTAKDHFGVQMHLLRFKAEQASLVRMHHALAAKVRVGKGWVRKIFQEMVKPIMDKLQANINRVKQKVVDHIWNPMVDFVKNKIVAPVKAFFMNAWNKITAGVRAIWDFIVSLWEKVKSIPNMVKDFFAWIIQKAGDAITRVAFGVADWLESSKQKAKEKCAWAEKGAVAKWKVVQKLCYYPTLVFYFVYGKLQDLLSKFIFAVTRIVKDAVKDYATIDFKSDQETKQACAVMRFAFFFNIFLNMSLYALCILFNRVSPALIQVVDLFYKMLTTLEEKIYSAFGLTDMQAMQYGTSAQAKEACEFFRSLFSRLPVSGLFDPICHSAARSMYGFKEYWDRFFHMLNLKIQEWATENSWDWFEPGTNIFASAEDSEKGCQAWQNPPLKKIGSFISLGFFVLCTSTYRIVNLFDYGVDWLFRKLGKLIHYEYPNLHKLQAMCRPVVLPPMLGMMACSIAVRVFMVGFDKLFELCQWVLGYAQDAVKGEGPIVDFIGAITKTIFTSLFAQSHDIFSTLGGVFGLDTGDLGGSFADDDGSGGQASFMELQAKQHEITRAHGELENHADIVEAHHTFIYESAVRAAARGEEKTWLDYLEEGAGLMDIEAITAIFDVLRRVLTRAGVVALKGGEDGDPDKEEKKEWRYSLVHDSVSAGKMNGVDDGTMNYRMTPFWKDKDTFNKNTDLSKCPGYIKLQRNEGMCTNSNIKRMLEAFGDAAIKVYELAGMEIEIDMKVVDCQQYTKGEEAGINDIEFTMGAMDDCEEYDLTAKKAFDAMFSSFIQPPDFEKMAGLAAATDPNVVVQTDRGKRKQFLDNFKQRTGKVTHSIQAWFCDKRDKYFTDGKYVSLVMCNSDTLSCPRNTQFAQNGGCNIRPFFGDVIIGKIEEGDQKGDVEQQLHFGENGVSVSMSIQFLGDVLGKLFKAFASAVTSNLEGLLSSLKDFKITLKLEKEMTNEVAQGDKSQGSWSFELVLDSFRDLESLYQVVAVKLGPGKSEKRDRWTDGRMNKCMSYYGPHFA
eukprot:g5600.t1